MKDISKGERERERREEEEEEEEQEEEEKTESVARDVRAITPRRTKKDESRHQGGATRRGDGEAG